MGIKSPYLPYILSLVAYSIHQSTFFVNVNMRGTLREGGDTMNNLQTFRIKAGLTQAELAEKTGIDQGGISRVEKGVSDFFGQRWKVVAEALECTVDELLGEVN